MATEPRPGGHGYPQWRHEAAAYVLGALSRRERHRFEHHLRGWPACRDQVVGLAGLPGLLALPEIARNDNGE